MICGAELVGVSDPFVRSLLAGLGEHNALWYRRNPDQPPPSSAGVRYKPDGKSRAMLLVDASTLLDAGVGSCGSISAAEFGWHRSRGRAATLVVRTIETAMWHVLVRLPGGQVWDPAWEVIRAA